MVEVQYTASSGDQVPSTSSRSNQFRPMKEQPPLSNKNRQNNIQCITHVTLHLSDFAIRTRPKVVISFDLNNRQIIWRRRQTWILENHDKAISIIFKKSLSTQPSKGVTAALPRLMLVSCNNEAGVPGGKKRVKINILWQFSVCLLFVNDKLLMSIWCMDLNSEKWDGSQLSVWRKDESLGMDGKQTTNLNYEYIGVESASQIRVGSLMTKT